MNDQYYLDLYERAWQKDPAVAAKNLYEHMVFPSAYIKLQQERKRRLDFFKTTGVNVLIEDSQKLYDYGEKVLAELIKIEDGGGLKS